MKVICTPERDKVSVLPLLYLFSILTRMTTKRYWKVKSKQTLGLLII